MSATIDENKENIAQAPGRSQPESQCLLPQTEEGLTFESDIIMGTP